MVVKFMTLMRSLPARQVWRTFFWQSLGFACIFVLRPLGVHHLGMTPIFCVVFLMINASILYVNRDMYDYVMQSLRLRSHQYMLAGLLMTLVVIYTIISPEPERLALFPNAHFAHIAYPYIVTKSFDIMFQQLAYGMFVHDLLGRKMPLYQIQLISMALLMCSHLATLHSMTPTLAITFIGAGGVAGFVFPVAIVSGGFAVAVSLHWIYYLGLGLYYNMFWF